jgi:hypothetical protein
MKTIARHATEEIAREQLAIVFQRAYGSREYGFRFAMAQKALNGTTSFSSDAKVPRKFLTMRA